MSSRNRWVAISTNGLLSGIRDSDAISAFPLDARAAHHERIDTLVVPQESAHVVLVDVHLGHVLRGDLRLPAPPAGGEEEAGERVPRHGDVLRDLLPEPFVEYAEIADRDVVHVFIVLVRHGLVRRTHPPDREPRPENRRDVAALAHRIQIPDDVPVDVRDRHVRERRNVAFDAEGGAGLPDGHVERGPSEVRLLAHAAREIVPHPLPELDDAVRSGLLDHVLDQGRESDVDHEVLRRPHTKELITCFRCARHSFSALAATASPSRSRSRSTTIVRNRSQCPAVMYGAVVPTSLYALVTIYWRGPGPTRAPRVDWFSRRYSRGSSWFGIDDEKMRPSTPENIAMSRSFSSRARFSSVSKRCFRWPTVSAPIVLSTWPAKGIYPPRFSPYELNRICRASSGE